MADVMPDYDLEKAQLDLQIAQQKLNIQSSEFRKMQLLSEIKRIDTNIAAAHEAIAKLEGDQQQIHTGEGDVDGR